MADSVKIKITGDDSDFRSKMSGLGSIAKKGALAVGAAFVTAGGYGLKLASDLQEVQNVVDVTFGETGAKEINDWAKAAGESFGLSELQAKQFTGTLGAMLKSMGMTDAATMDMSTAMVGLAGDFASFYNLDPAEAFEKIRSGISGETEPLKQLGINMSVANLEAYALSQGIDKSYNSMTQAEQATLRYNYLMSVSADAQGDFARTSDSFANQMRIAKLEVSTMAAALGEILLPIATTAVTKFTDFVKSIDLEKAKATVLSFMATVKKLIPVIASVVAVTTAWKAGLLISKAVSAVTTAIRISTGVMAFYSSGAKVATVMTSGFSTAQKVMGTIMAIATGKVKLMTAAQWALKAAMSANPIGLIIIAIVALVAAFVLLWNKCGWFRDFIIGIWDKIKEAWDAVLPYFQALWENIKIVWDTIAPYLTAAWEIIKAIFSAALSMIFLYFSTTWTIIKAVWDFVQPYFQALWDGIQAVFSVVVEVLGGFFSATWDAIKLIWDAVGPYFQMLWDVIKGIFSVVKAVLSGDFSGAWEAIKGIWNAVTGYFDDIWKGIKKVFDNIEEWFSEKFEAAYNAIKDWFTLDNFKSVFKDSIVGGLEGILEDVKTAASDIWQAIKDALSQKIEVVLDFLGIGDGGDYGYDSAGVLSPFGARISSGFGAQRSGHKHGGVDFAAPTGTPIQATTTGMVIRSTYQAGGFGNYVVVQDRDGNTHYYGHMSKKVAYVGELVGRGSLLGYVGSTGHSTGPHLHYEVRQNGKAVNPYRWYASARGYATGGYPLPGELFFANENGIELMGKMGSKNVVANNMQIIEGIKAGIASGAVQAARARANAGLTNNNNKQEINVEQHFYKENVSPSETKRAARRGIKAGLAGGIA